LRSSSHAERTEVPAKGHPADPDVLDARHSRPLPKQIQKPFQCGRVPLRLHLNGAIVAVADIAVEPKPAGMRLGKIPEANALDVTEDLRLEAAPL
jgi:hypothetical protein